MIIGYFVNKKKYNKYDKNTVFFIGAPEYGNLGDQAIADAEVVFLRKTLPKKEIIIIPESESIENLLCIKKITNKYHNICAFIGGGNMGDLYFFQENLRLTAVKLLKNAKIVIFPQSIDYDGTSTRFKKAKKIYESHKSLFLFTREKKSEEKRKRLFSKCKGGLVPDIVLSLSPTLETFKREEIFFCMRSDIEKNSETKKIVNELENFTNEMTSSIKKLDTRDNKYCTKYINQHNQLINFWEKFAQASLIITDRLHGMIFSIITNTPCIALDNNTGKIRSLYETWLNENMVCFIDSTEKIEKAKQYIKESKNKNQDNTKYLKEITQHYKPLEKCILDFDKEQ